LNASGRFHNTPVENYRVIESITTVIAPMIWRLVWFTTHRNATKYLIFFRFRELTWNWTCAGYNCIYKCVPTLRVQRVAMHCWVE